ncbi:SpoIIE family protein phosphatase [Phycisphaeraceae bacterium D3-23]
MTLKTDNLLPTPADVRLAVAGPDGASRSFGLDRALPVTLGRGASCEVRLEHEQVSRRHAEVAWTGGRWVVRDLGSRNGVLCNGVRLTSPVALEPGIAITVGPYTLTLLGGAAATPARLPREPAEYHTIAAVDDRKTSTVLPLTHTPKQFDPAILSKLHQIDQWLMDLPDQDGRYRKLCEFVLHANPGAHYCAVLEPGTVGDAEVRVLQSVSRRPTDTPYLSRTLLDQVASTGQPTQLSNTPTPGDDIMLSIAPEEVLLSAIACPLEEVKGGPIFYATFHANEVDASWLDLMVLIADQYRHAQALLRVVENANERAALDRDLGRAREIQSGLLPRPWSGDGLEIAYGFRPCHMVGGDYLDVIPMPDGRVLLAIADVAGKGLQAALISSSIHTMVHAVIHTGGDLPEVFHQLNRYLIHYAPAGSFASGIIAAVDPKTGEADVLNAGHPPIVSIDAQGKSSTLQHETGYLPLGIDEQDYQNAHATIAPGASWFFYTDGLSELPLPDGGLLGVEGVARVTEELNQGDPQRTTDAWMRHMETHNADLGQADDQTLICLRRPG